MIDFHRITAADRQIYQEIALASPNAGCEYSFVNLCCWGLQTVAYLHGCAVLFSHFRGHSIYPFPIGPGDRRACIEEIIRDSRERGVPCRITSILPGDAEALESWFPGMFRFRIDRDGADYLYDIDDLADLKGRKFQKKRNHVNSFRKLHPDWRTEPLTDANIPAARELVANWYIARRQADPDGDYLLESMAINRAFRHFACLDLEGILLLDGDTPLAMAMGSRLNFEVFDIHFEKAIDDSAYAAVNQAFAQYLREQHPEVRFLDREDDMGLEGLRKAKMSYSPVKLIDKQWAYLRENCFPEETDGEM